MESDPPITWDSFFALMRQRSWKGWQVMVDTSMALFPAAELLIEERDHFIAQSAWLSIGYTAGAWVGAKFGAGGGKRVVAFAGDGGFQMLPQVLSTLARARKAAVLFVFANGMYGIEQYLVDKTYFRQDNPPAAAFFNQLAVWKYQDLATAFGAKGFPVATVGDLRGRPHRHRCATDGPALVEVKLDRATSRRNSARRPRGRPRPRRRARGAGGGGGTHDCPCRLQLNRRCSNARPHHGPVRLVGVPAHVGTHRRGIDQPAGCPARRRRHLLG